MIAAPALPAPKTAPAVIRPYSALGIAAPALPAPALPAAKLPAPSPLASAAAPLAPVAALVGAPAEAPVAPAADTGRWTRFFDRGGKAKTTPADFGAPGGTSVPNGEQVLADVDRLVNGGKAPAFELVLVEPLSMLRIGRSRSTGTNPYAHAAVRYTMPNGEQKFMNIVGKKGHQLVNFVTPVKYLFDVNEFGRSSEQGGLYNRAMNGVRIEKLPAEQILALDRYYRELAERNKAGAARFTLSQGPLRNLWSRLTGKAVEWGNCGYWSSCGVAAGGILPGPNMWPKLGWIQIYEKYKKLDPSNVHVVSYRKIKHAVRTYGVNGRVPEFVAPFRWIKAARYWNLEKRADVIVEVPEGSIEARATLVEKKTR